jgi:hypothetical protein
VESHRAQVPREVEVDDAGFDPHRPRVAINLTDPSHAGKRHDDRRTQRDRSACEAGSGASGHNGATVPAGRSNHRLHLVGRARKAHWTCVAAVEH